MSTRRGAASLVARLGLSLGLAACSSSDKGESTAASRVEVAEREDPNAQAADPEPFPAQTREGAGPAGDFAPEAPADLEESADAPASEARQRGNFDGRLDDVTGTSKSSGAKKKRKKSPKSKRDAAANPSARPGGAAMPPAAEPPREQSERSIADPDGLLASLDSLEMQLRSAGLRLPQDAGSDKLEEKQKEGFNCEKVCEIRGAICALEERICSLADAHPEDDRYANACERASGDCRVAKAACSTCD